MMLNRKTINARLESFIPLSSLTVSKHVRTKLPLLSHDIENENPLFILTIKNATRRHYYFPVYGIGQLRRNTSGLRKICQPFGLIENLLDQVTCCSRIIQGNIFSDGFQFLQSGR